MSVDDIFQKDLTTHALESSPGLSTSHLTERRCKLTVLTGRRKGEAVEIESLPFRVGKGPKNDLQLPDPTVSREHFELVLDRGSFLVRDLGSTNGTWIDQMRVREAYLRPGAVIKAGEVQIRFEPLFRPIEIVPSERTSFGPLVGRSLAMRQIFALLERVAKTDATVVILGETGTGKGAVARAIHEASPRRDGPFVVVDCGAIAPNLIESELFGHEKGAFTGATQTRRGALEQAASGTLFIDELVDLQLDLQPKLLRALEEREFRRLGSTKPLKLEARVIAASQRDLWAEVQRGAFREDLYFRLAVFTIPLPPLRERLEDIPLLVEKFARELGADEEAMARFDGDLLAHLAAHDWPGNVRELRNAVERILYFGADQLDFLLRASPTARSAGPARPGPELAASVPEAASAAHGAAGGERGEVAPSGEALRPDYDLPFKEAKERLVEAFEAEYVRRLLARCRGQISLAAREAGIDRKHLYNLMRKHGIEPGDLRSAPGRGR